MMPSRALYDGGVQDSARGHGEGHAHDAHGPHDGAAEEPAAAHGHHDDGGGGAHGHVHGRPMSTPGALRVLGIASAGLFAVCAVELAVSMLSGSAAVLADGLHNLGDVLTTVALAGAFLLSDRAPTRRFPYGYHRGEDLAGIVVVLLIVGSAIASGVTSVEHLLHPSRLTHPGVALAAALVGFAGNEAVARYKTVMGRRLHSVSLVADGQHSRIDGLASLGAAAGVGGAWAGVTALDPVAGLLLTGIIALVALDTARNVTARLLDEADASLLATIEEVAAAAPGVASVSEVRARWTGRRLRAELVLTVAPDETVSRAHALGEEVRHALFHRIEALADVVVHLDPAGDAEAHQAVRHHQPERTAGG
jgi:cation diffusion facilitator family transporter